MALIPEAIQGRRLLVVPALVAFVYAFAFASPFGTANKSPLAVDAPPDASTVDEIKNTISKYTKSVEAADTALASQIWLDSPEVSFIHPLGHEHGFEQIKQNVYTRLMGQTFSERRLSAHDISVHAFGDCAWAEFYWDFTATLRKDGSSVVTHGRETQIYRKQQGAWRLVLVHYSAMPPA